MKNHSSFSTKSKIFIGLLLASVGGGSSYFLVSNNFRAGADTFSGSASGFSITLLVGSVIIGIWGLALLVSSIIGNKK